MMGIHENESDTDSALSILMDMVHILFEVPFLERHQIPCVKVFNTHLEVLCSYINFCPSLSWLTFAFN
jgi:hypothetical protein